MSLRLSGLNPLAYMGVEPTSPALFITNPSSPSINDWQNFNLGTVWLNTTSQVPYMLVSLAGNQAVWIPLGSSADIQTLMGNSGFATGNVITVTTGNNNVQGTALFTGDDVSTLTLTFSDGDHNTGAGTTSLASGSLSGSRNSAYGSLTGSGLTAGSDNTLLGFDTGTALTTGDENVAVGSIAGYRISTGSQNTLLGTACGSNYTTSESSNICIGAGTLGTAAESHVLRIGKAKGTNPGYLNKAYIQGIYGNTGFTGSPTYVGIDSTGYLGVLAGGGSGGATNFITDDGDASVDGSGNISILGTMDYITTSAMVAPNTVSVNVGDFVATSFTTDDSSTINPSSNNVIVKGAGSITTSSTGNTITITGSGGGASKITFFTSTGSNTWTKAVGTNMVSILGWGGGGGGASGNRGTASISYGGGGGAPTSCFYWVSPANFFGASETAFVGSGGSGGAAIGINSTPGNNGSPGTASYFGNIKPAAFSFDLNGGRFGNGGTPETQAAVGGQFFNFANAFGVTNNNGNIAAQCAVFPKTVFVSNAGVTNPMRVGGVGVPSTGVGGNGSNIGGLLSTPYGNFGYSFVYFVPTAGGSGGGSSAVVGGNGGNVLSLDGLSTLLAGGAGGAATMDGSAGNDSINTDGSQLITGGLIYGGTGGGGGGGNGGAGAVGGFPGGGGGGGGGTANGTASGAGGDGADGLIIVIEW